MTRPDRAEIRAVVRELSPQVVGNSPPFLWRFDLRMRTQKGIRFAPQECPVWFQVALQLPKIKAARILWRMLNVKIHKAGDGFPIGCKNKQSALARGLGGLVVRISFQLTLEPAEIA